MKFTQSVVLTFATVALTACFSGTPSTDTVKGLIERNGMDVARAQANAFRPRPMNEDELAKLPNAYNNINVSDCREDEAVESEYLCFVKMEVKTILGVIPFEEDVRIRRSEEGEWRLVSR